MTQVRKAAVDFNLHGVRMVVVSSAPTACVSAETFFQFEQLGSLVSARYRGGGIVDGYLIGRIEHSTLTFRYVQADREGNLDAGRSMAEMTREEGGRLRLMEHFSWETRPGAGTNIFEEVPSADDH